MGPAHRPEQGRPNKHEGVGGGIERSRVRLQMVEGMAGDEERRQGRQQLRRLRFGDSGPDGACDDALGPRDQKNEEVTRRRCLDFLISDFGGKM